MRLPGGAGRCDRSVGSESNSFPDSEKCDFLEQRFVQNIIFIQAAAYPDLQNYEMGLQAMLIDPDKCSLLIGEPNLNTLRKILNVEE